LRVTSVAIESDDAFTARVVEERPARIRLIGADGTVVEAAADGGGADAPSARPASAVARDIMVALEGDPDVAIWSSPVTLAGRVELLPFLREQAVSLTAHRYGNPYSVMAELAF
jgi:RHH-type proline utilization regulon transcriptional repressor/proline dehydrogenase/delta 1-pyrroline-5-carboxylate dehydrogenase